MIKTYKFKSKVTGPLITVFGAVHGNEVCGEKAIKKIVERIETGSLILKKGGVVFAPVCNPRANSKNERYIDEDLNRVFKKTEKPASYEQELANTLCGLVDDTEILLDIHSTSALGPPTVFLDFPTEANVRLAKSTGINLAILGWPELYCKHKKLLSGDTMSYANEKGKDSILVECGQHVDQKAIVVAETVILRVMAGLGMIDGQTESSPDVLPTKMKFIRMSELFVKEDDKDFFAKKWSHLEEIKKDELIATRASGEKIISNSEMVMILPKHQSDVGKEWFYLGCYEKL